MEDVCLNLGYTRTTHRLHRSNEINTNWIRYGRCWSLVAGRWSPFRISPGLPIIPTRPLLASWSAALHTDDPQAALDLFPCSPRGGSPASSRLISGHPSGVLARSACFTTGRRAGCVQTVVVSRRSNLIHVACGMGERSQGLLHSIGGIVMASHHISD